MLTFSGATTFSQSTDLWGIFKKFPHFYIFEENGKSGRGRSGGVL
jgi:hypothetical protein